jgi:predicted amidohydrolase
MPIVVSICHLVNDQPLPCLAYLFTMRIAIAQTCPVSAPPGVYSAAEASVDNLSITLRRNLEDAEEIVKEAVQRHQADVVCFPEYFLQGILNEGRQVRH